MARASAALATLAARLVMDAGAQTVNPECKSFEEVYTSGKDLCEQMWDGAFKYEPDESKAFTMWFFEEQNPNDAMARSMGKLGTNDHDTCFLQYFHKSAPSPEPDTFTECHPWKDSACCSHGTVETYTKLKEGYGPEYHWDRCGPLSQACERFFVQEACFYECDPNAGLYRKYNTSVYDPRCDEGATGYDKSFAESSGCSHNTWQMHGMPIKASYCDAWFDACRHDKFCAHSGGSFFSCAAVYEQVDLEAEKLKEKEAEVAALKQENEDLKDDGELSTAALVGIIVPSVVACLGLCLSCLLIRQEKLGKPMFGRLMDDRDAGTAQKYGNSGL
eukprot:gb/GFBE01001342.1/.p1 GENE.gb/GFBE01001342.1/~~gb/GFBE01001342.1/.p1  ORF type:complete len:332 (+),score=89.51 gb/GFBE01001342.1/:1-996(+)